MESMPPPPPSEYSGDAARPRGNPLVGYWKLVVLERYAQFTGRANRAEYWWFVLANLIINLVFDILGRVTAVFAIIGLLYALAVLIPGIAVAVRRLHDTNRSGWWLLIGLIPIVGWIVIIVFLVQDTVPGMNQWGPPATVAAS
ncbi:MAG TPA: DUF805 domain-containing protein [Acidimicrobiales bacterium]|nr:DUF805 domain-containing protein [Acidimicrobiales bacterium]